MQSINAPVAQGLEHRPYKAGVDGSKPSRRTNITAIKTITVKKESNKQRLDIFFTKKTKLPRSQVQKMIKTEAILINDKPAKKTGSTVKTSDISEW